MGQGLLGLPMIKMLCSPSHYLFFFLSPSSRDESAVYLAGLGTVGMEIYEQVPKLDAVVVPAAGQYGLLAGTAAAIKHLNSQTLVIVGGWRDHLSDVHPSD